MQKKVLLYGVVALLGISAGIILASLFCGDRVIIQNDTWWQIIAGRDILSGNWPIYNTWSWSLPHARWMVQEPWFDVLDAVFARYGYYGLSALTFFFILVSSFLMWDILKKYSHFNAVLLLTFYLVMSIYFWECRPQIVDYAGMVFLLWALENKRYLFILPAVVLWANMHSGVMIAPVILTLFAALAWLPDFNLDRIVNESTGRMQLTFTTILSYPATLLTHNGFWMWEYAVRTILDTKIFGLYIQEWMPPPLISMQVRIEYFLIPVTMIIIGILSKEKIKLGNMLLLMGLYFVAMRSYRFLPYALSVWIIVIGQMMAEDKKTNRKPTALIYAAGLLVSLIGATFIIGLPSKSLASTARYNGYPVGAVEYIETHHLKNVYNEYGWGGYLIFNNIPVYIDGRSEVYYWNEGDIFTKYMDAESRLANVNNSLKSADTLLLASNSILQKYIAEDPEWVLVRKGKNDMLYIHQGEVNYPALKGRSL